MVRVIISGGGTGGHIFPAIAIANAMKQKNKQTEILFVGALGKMEMEKVPAAGYTIEGLPITGIQRKLTLSNLLFPIKLVRSILLARKIIKKFKPNVVVGVGGFASGPLLYAATRMKIPALIQEQNSFPGITNKWLCTHVQSICVAYDGMEKYFPANKIKFTGNPVRNDILHLEGKRERAAEIFKLDLAKKTVFVTGGSLGAQSINEGILTLLPWFAEQGIQLIWQTGKPYFSTASKATAAYANKGIYAYEFISTMDYAYAIADLVVSRAGAGAVSELSLAKKAAILIPYPYAAEDHQTKNAQALVNHMAAVMIMDDEENKASKVLAELINNEEKRNRLAHCITGLAIANSADVIAEEIFYLATKSST